MTDERKLADDHRPLLNHAWTPVAATAQLLAELFFGEARTGEPVPSSVLVKVLFDLLAMNAELYRALLARTGGESGAGASAGEGMGARLVERAFGPSTAEVLDVLSATEHQLDIERQRSADLAALLLRVVDVLFADPIERERHRTLCKSLIARQKADSAFRLTIGEADGTDEGAHDETAYSGTVQGSLFASSGVRAPDDEPDGKGDGEGHDGEGSAS